MNIFSMLSLIESLAFAALGVAALLLNRIRTENRLFFIMTISLSWWLFLVAMGLSTESRDTLILIYKLTTPSFSFFFAINLHFYLVMLKKKLSFRKILLLYLPAPIVFFSTIFDVSLFSNFIPFHGTWRFIPAKESIWFYFFCWYVITYSLAIIIILFYRLAKGATNKEKRQARIILTSLAIVVFMGVLDDFILEGSQGYDLPPIGTLWFILYFIALLYSIMRYRFLNLNTSMVVDEIVSNIRDIVIIMDTELTITTVNSSCICVLAEHEGVIQGSSFMELIEDGELMKEDFEVLLREEMSSVLRRLRFSQCGEAVIADAYISLVKDRFHDPVGFLVIARENRGVADLQRRYHITGRQLAVMELAVKGATNGEIAKRLGITRRTVEAHLDNMYYRLGIGNRIELLNVARDYGVISN
jgi:DNA-binding CsgD family transcriptional regulator